LLQAAAGLLVTAIVAETVVALFIAGEVIVAVCRQFFHLFVLAHRTAGHRRGAWRFALLVRKLADVYLGIRPSGRLFLHSIAITPMSVAIELRPNALASPRTARLTKTFILNLDKLGRV
jgi:hypothetical protein